MEVFLYILLTLAAAAMALAFVGARLPRTHVAASRIRFRAAPERVYEILADFEHYPDWRPGLDRVERGPDLEGHPSWFEICAGIGRVHFRIVEAKSPERLMTRIVDDKLPLSGQWTYRIEAEDHGTVLTITEEENIHNPLLRVFDRFILSYHGVMDVYLTALAQRLDEPSQPEHLSLELGGSGPGPQA